ncbi:CTRB [Mytilus coruscus]|uniref:CTRB n=1 Tax=Mytilus coruscus TaxID=42192 RepID=A0A6J8D2P8_MYTCO|nr:CTRB [Mytilus coruscus]
MDMGDSGGPLQCQEDGRWCLRAVLGRYTSKTNLGESLVTRIFNTNSGRLLALKYQRIFDVDQMAWDNQEMLVAIKRNLSVLEYKHTKSGIVLTADAVTFALLRLATLNYVKNLPEIRGQANIRKTTIVQHIIKFALNNRSYTINIYNTTCTLVCLS